MLDFCAIDFETANANRGSACAVGLARVRDGVLVENIGGYIRPPDDLFWFDFANTRVNGLTEQHVLRAPDWRKALAKICEFVAEDQVFAHNAAFDWSVIIGGIAHGAFSRNYFPTVYLAPTVRSYWAAEGNTWNWSSTPPEKVTSTDGACTR